MKLYYAARNLTEKNKNDILALLTECDRDFCPPLSARESSVQKNLAPGAAGGGVPLSYFNAMLEQDFLLCEDDSGTVTGFLTFRRHYTCPELAPETDTIYLTTMAVSHRCRGLGISQKLFDLAEQTAPELGCRVMTTRTWSTNAAQMHILPGRGYELVCRLPDDRGPGIDTVYFRKYL